MISGELRNKLEALLDQLSETGCTKQLSKISDEELGEKLCGEYFGAIQAACYRYNEDPHEILSDVFIKLKRYIAEYDYVTFTEKLVYRTASHVALDRKKVKKIDRHSEHYDKYELDKIDYLAKDDNHLTPKIRWEFLEQLFGPTQVEILRMYLEGYSCAEICRMRKDISNVDKVRRMVKSMIRKLKEEVDISDIFELI